MDKEKLICLICNKRFSKVSIFKQHLDSFEHAREFEECYKERSFQAKRKFTPWIFYKDYDFKPDKPILGLSQMTLCFSSETSFYLCHLCEEVKTADSIVNHVFDSNHYHNYFAFTKPNALNMSDDPLTLDDFKKEQEKNGIGELQVLHLPQTMLKPYIIQQSYRKVRIWLHSHKCLAKRFNERVRERVKIQAYVKDPNRKHPLVGLQHIVEAVCVSPQLETNVFLCTLCRLQLDSGMIIRHLLSFDHLYNYFSDVDPTLKEKECYRNDCTLTDLAMQSKKHEGHTNIQRVYLNPRQISAVVYASFKDALSQMETIMKKRSLKVKPGRKLGLCTSGDTATSTAVSTSTSPQPHSLHCQICNQRFDTVTRFFDHLRMSEHLENIRKNFGQVIDESTLQSRSQLPILQHLTENYHSCVGKSLVVTIISQLDQKPVHMCFACEVVFLNDTFNLHMNSPRHIVQSLMVKNPWRLPFAWKTDLDLKYIKLQACSEEEETGTEQRILRVLDVPSNLFTEDGSHTFSQVMDRLKLTMNDVTQCEALNQETDRFPLLGRNFLVKYGKTTNGYKFLCLLCERILSSDGYAGHVFSEEHVFSFLGRFHPGSLDSHTTNEEVLDMAKQAALIHPISKEQEVEFEIHEVSAYLTKVRLLTAAVRQTGKGPLMPAIHPKRKLVPRQMKKDCVLKSEENVIEITQPPSEKCSEKLSGGVPSVDQITSIQTTKEVPGEPVCKPPASCPTEEVPSMERQQCDSNMNTRVSETESVDLKGSPEETLSLQTATGGRSSSDAVADSASCCRNILWLHLQEKNRPPIIGLSAVVECICQDLAPIYVCDCCHLVFKEQHITKHLCETWHYVNYLNMVGEKPPTQITTWRTALFSMADDWEKSEGYGEAQTLELTPEEFNKLASTSGYKEAKKILKNHKALQANDKTDQQDNFMNESPNFDVFTLNTPQLKDYLTRLVKGDSCGDTSPCDFCVRKSFARNNVKIETNPEPCSVPMKINMSSEIETNSKLHQEMTTTLPHSPEESNTPPISLNLTGTLTKTENTQISISSSDLSSSETSSNPKPGSQNTPIDSILKTEDETFKPSKLVCKFIARGTVFENESKTTAASVEDIDNNNVYVPSASSTITATPKSNSTSTCKFMTSQSANQNVFTPVTTCLAASSSTDSTANVKTSPCDRSVGILPNTQTTVVSVIDNSTKVNDIPPITRATDSNSAKDAPNQSVGSAAVCRQKADSMLPSDTISKVALSDSNTSVVKKTIPIPSAAPAKSTANASDEHTKSTGTHLKLNLNAVTDMKKDGPGSFSPSSPNFSPRPPTTEVSEKVTKIGYDQMLRVKCNESSHTYCFACLEIIYKTNHLTSKSHQMNCVKAKYPSWDAQLNERTLCDMVAQFAEEEKAKGRFACKDLEIPLDLYRELRNLPPAKAIEKVQYLINKGLKKPADRRLTPKASASPRDSLSASLTDLDLGNEDNPTNPQDQIIAEHLIKIPRTITSPPVQKPMSKVAPRIIKGSTSDEPSLLSRVLAVMNRPVVGLRFLWECRDWRMVPPRAPTFYLCECCCETIVVGKITEHLDNFQHKSNFLMREYETFMFWKDENLLPEMMIELINDISDWVLCREELMDVQIVLLKEECFEWVRTAPFSDALYVVQRIKQEMETTSLPRIVTQHDDQIMNPDSPSLDGNTSAPIAETCPSPPESAVTPSLVTSPETCPAQSPASAKQPDMPRSSVFTPHLSAPPNDEHQTPCEADIPILSSQIVSEMPKQISEPFVTQSPTHFSEQPQPSLTIQKNTSNKTLNDYYTKSIEADLKGSSESSVVAPSSTNDDDTQSPLYQADMFQMLLDLIKQSYPSVALQEPCGSGSSETSVPGSKRCDVGPISNTDTEMSPKEDLTEPMTSADTLSVMSRNYSKDSLSSGVLTEELISNEQGKQMIRMESESNQAQNEEHMIPDLKMYVLNSQDSMESFQTRFQESHKDDQPIDKTTGAGNSQNSQQTLELQITLETQKGPMQCLTPDHMQHESLSTETVKIKHTPVKAQQSQVEEEPPLPYATQQTQDQTLQIPIYSLVPAIPQTAVQFLGDRDDRPIPDFNPNVQINQGFPSDSEAGATRDYSHFLSMPVEHAYLHNSAYPSQLFHQLQAQQYYTFIQNAGASGISHSGGQTSYLNAGEAGTNNVVQLNTFGHQCYTYNYNNLQNYNSFLMQNYFQTQTYSPGSEESQFSLYRQ